MKWYKYKVNIQMIAHDAFKTLINLSSEVEKCVGLIDEEFVFALVKLIIHPAFILADLACMLLSNMTKMESCCLMLLQVAQPGVEGIYVRQLMYIYLFKVVKFLEWGKNTIQKQSFTFWLLYFLIFP